MLIHNGIGYETVENFAIALNADYAKLKAERDALVLQNEGLQKALDSEKDVSMARKTMAENLSASLNEAERELATANRLINDLRSALNDVLDISEVEGAVNLTVMEDCKIKAARDLVYTEKRKCEHNPCDCPDCKRIGAVCTKCDEPTPIENKREHVDGCIPCPCAECKKAAATGGEVKGCCYHPGPEPALCWCLCHKNAKV